MFTSSGGITHLEQQHLYDLAYDDWSFSTMHAPPGFQEGCFMYEMPEKKVMKKPTKKDRHSKILTAQGARDRRMRLSLDIAKQFFYLQDQLGFDKASKTVEWLLNQSKASIKELARIKAKGSCEGKGSSSLMLDEEVQSEIEETSSHDNTNKEKPIKEKKVSVYRKRVFDPLARESRAKARLRAKQRTWLKKNKSISDSPLETAAVNDAFNSIDLHHGSSSNTVESFSSIYSFENLDSSQNQPGRPSNSSSYDNSHINLSTETAQDRLISFPFSPSSTTPFIDLPLWSKPWEVFSN